MVRHKNRYIVVEINECGKKDTERLELKADAFHTSIYQQVQKLHGDFGAAAIRPGFTAKYCNEWTRIAIVRSRKGPHKLVASSIPCIKLIAGKLVNVNTLYVGATIRHCFKFIKNYQEKKFNSYCLTLKSDEAKIALKEAIMDLDSVLAIV